MLKNLNSKNRIVINEGSSRSGKTYNIMIMLITLMLTERNILITVARKTLPALKGSAYRDFLEILNNYGLYSEKNHNKSELIYKIGTNEIEFISVDNFEKVKGRKRHYLFCNEANELDKNDFTQLALRTTRRIFMDYNPSHESWHWIETTVKTRKDCEVIHSTYQDNPFLPDEVVKEIEMLKDTDENLWRIYGLGIMGISITRVFNNWELIDELPENYHDKFYGLDFGYNHPNALTEIREQDDEFYVKELVYKRFQTNTELIAEAEELGIDKTIPIYADSAYPAYIREWQDAGYYVIPANKEKGSVKAGINMMKSKKIYLTKDSPNIQSENRTYSWPINPTTGEPDEKEPVKFKDDAMDSIRYGIYTRANSPFIGVVD